VVGIIWLVFAAAIIFMVSRPAELPVPAETRTVTIRSGDTLWNVAGGVAPDADPRVTVDQIMELNGLQSASDLQPGDVLMVPVAGD
jgi:nucleoid-associated protein YgaU